MCLFCDVQLSLGLIKCLLMGHFTSVFFAIDSGILNFGQIPHKYVNEEQQLLLWQGTGFLFFDKHFVIVQTDMCLHHFILGSEIIETVT